MQEGNLSNLYKGKGETGETEEERTPLGIVQPLSSPDKGSVVKIIQNQVEELEELKSPQTLIQQGTLIIPDKRSVIKAISTPSSQPRNTLLEIPEGYWHIFDQMSHNQQTPQTSTL